MNKRSLYRYANRLIDEDLLDDSFYDDAVETLCKLFLQTQILARYN